MKRFALLMSVVALWLSGCQPIVPPAGVVEQADATAEIAWPGPRTYHAMGYDGAIFPLWRPG